MSLSIPEKDNHLQDKTERNKNYISLICCNKKVPNGFHDFHTHAIICTGDTCRSMNHLTATHFNCTTAFTLWPRYVNKYICSNCSKDNKCIIDVMPHDGVIPQSVIKEMYKVTGISRLNINNLIGGRNFVKRWKMMEQSLFLQTTTDDGMVNANKSWKYQIFNDYDEARNNSVDTVKINPIILRNINSSNIKANLPSHTSLNIFETIISRAIVSVVDHTTQVTHKLPAAEVRKFLQVPIENRFTNIEVTMEVSTSLVLENDNVPPALFKNSLISYYNRLKVERLDRRMNDKFSYQENCFAKYIDGETYSNYKMAEFGASYWFHLVSGNQIYYLIKGDKRQENFYFEYYKDKQSYNSEFRDRTGSDSELRIELNAGESLFLPSGCIFAFYTIRDSMGYGGEVYTTDAVDTQNRIAHKQISGKCIRNWDYYDKFMNFNLFYGCRLLTELGRKYILTREELHQTTYFKKYCRAIIKTKPTAKRRERRGPFVRIRHDSFFKEFSTTSNTKAAKSKSLTPEKRYGKSAIQCLNAISRIAKKNSTNF